MNAVRNGDDCPCAPCVVRRATYAGPELVAGVGGVPYSPHDAAVGEMARAKQLLALQAQLDDAIAMVRDQQTFIAKLQSRIIMHEGGR